MVTCLIEANSTVEVIFDGIMQCLQSFKDTGCNDYSIYFDSRSENILILLGILLDANSDVTKYNT